jgi:hypothetical protein
MLELAKKSVKAWSTTTPEHGRRPLHFLLAAPLLLVISIAGLCSGGRARTSDGAGRRLDRLEGAVRLKGC